MLLLLEWCQKKNKKKPIYKISPSKSDSSKYFCKVKYNNNKEFIKIKMYTCIIIGDYLR